MVKLFGKQKAGSRRILKYSKKPEEYLSDLRQRDKTAIELGREVIKLLITQIDLEKDPIKAGFLLKIALECGLSREYSDDEDSWKDMGLNEIFLTNSEMSHMEQVLAGILINDECQKTIVDALKSGEKLGLDYLILFVRLARSMSKASSNNPVPALNSLLHYASRGGGRDYVRIGDEVAETLLALEVQEAVEPIIEYMKCRDYSYTSEERLSQQLMRIINIKDTGILKKFMASNSEHVRRFVLIHGCLNRETIWKDEESQKCLEAIYSSDSNHTCALLAAYALARSGRKDLAPFVLEILKDSKFRKDLKLDEEEGLVKGCIKLLCSFHESKALPIFIRWQRDKIDTGGWHKWENSLIESLLDNTNYIHFPAEKVAELLCLMLETADLDYIDRLSDALIRIGDHQISGNLEKFSSSDEKRLFAAFNALVGLNEIEILINILLNSEGTRATAAGNALSSINDKSVTEKIFSNYKLQLPWSRRKALIQSLGSSKEILKKILEIEQDLELRKLIEGIISD